MPGHSYKGSTAQVGRASPYPPIPFLDWDRDDNLWIVSVLKIQCSQGRPTFECYESITGIGDPQSNPADWRAVDYDSSSDDATHYIENFVQIEPFGIARTRYGLLVSGWTPILGA